MANLTAQEEADFRARLATLEAARNALEAGNKPTEVSLGEETTKFQPVSLANVNMWIREIKCKLGEGPGRIAL